MSRASHEGKALAVVEALDGRPDCPVLAADTTVALDGKIFGKPADEADCVGMLMALAGRTHEVLTTIALWYEGGLHVASSTSYVTFREIGEPECRRYWGSGEPAGKAGAYAIQGLGAVFVARLEGSSFMRHGPAAVRNRGASRCRGRAPLAASVIRRNAVFAALVQA